jgi:hypothetical protein
MIGRTLTSMSQDLPNELVNNIINKVYLLSNKLIYFTISSIDKEYSNTKAVLNEISITSDSDININVDELDDIDRDFAKNPEKFDNIAYEQTLFLILNILGHISLYCANEDILKNYNSFDFNVNLEARLHNVIINDIINDSLNYNSIDTILRNSNDIALRNSIHIILINYLYKNASKLPYNERDKILNKYFKDKDTKGKLDKKLIKEKIKFLSDYSSEE